MTGLFFSHPLWQKFQNRAITVCRLSDGEHRLRDSYANFLLKDFLPPDTRFATFLAGREGGAYLGNSADGLIVVGRLSLFPRRIRTLFKTVQPSMVYDFASNILSRTAEYRTIQRIGLRKMRPLRKYTPLDASLVCESFEQQRKNNQETLTDYGLVYSGWRGKQPVMYLAGTSTVGTWGATQFVIQAPSPGQTALWQQDVQGVVDATVSADADAYDEVESNDHELLAPARFWLEGGSLPPKDGWTRSVLQLETDARLRKIDLRIIVNGHVISNLKSYLSVLVLLSWLSVSHRVDSYPDGFTAEVTTGKILRSLFNFLKIAENPMEIDEIVEQSNGARPPVKRVIKTMTDFAESRIGRNLCDTLKELTAAIREAGGLAYAIEDPAAPSNTARWTFRVASRNLPHFFPDIP